MAKGYWVANLTVTDPDPERAKLLATAYAEAFTAYRRELDTRALTRARLDVEETLDEVGGDVAFLLELGDGRGDPLVARVDRGVVR